MKIFRTLIGDILNTNCQAIMPVFVVMAGVLLQFLGLKSFLNK
jgi:hypothetical protein